MTDPTTPDEKPPIIVPLIADPPKTVPAAPPPPAPKGMRFVLLSGAAALGLFLIVLGTVLVFMYLFSDKEHLHEKIVLFVGIGFIAAGAHFVSRQSVRNFLADFGKFIPWGKKSDTEEQPTDGSGS